MRGRKIGTNKEEIFWDVYANSEEEAIKKSQEQFPGKDIWEIESIVDEKHG